MNLTSKLIFSHLVAILVGLSVLIISTVFIAPIDFSQHMMGNMSGSMAQNMQNFQAESETAFRNSLNNALFVAGSTAMLVAVLLSSYLSARIVRPIKQLVNASQRIAAGRYDLRLDETQADEISELTHNFNRMAAALTNIEHTRQQLIADVSHELKTPLTSIKGYMEGLQDGVIPATTETFELVHNEADRLQHLVEDLQELSRAEAFQLPMKFQPCRPADLIQKTVTGLRPQFDEKGVELVVNLPVEFPTVQADPDRIRQVLINLLGNALQYTSAGGRVAVHSTRDGTILRFSVEDTGRGLAPEDLERVFIRFYRVDKSRARTSGGSGIGLTIARHIVEIHGGIIWAESEGEGKGSMFSFTLPLS